MSSRQPAANSYARAPIEEAVLEMRLEAAEPLNEPTLLSEAIDGYEDAVPLREVEASFHYDPAGASTSSKLRVSGYRFRSKDKRTTLVSRPSTFAVSWIGQYAGWSVFRAEAIRAWELTAPRLKSEKVVRFGLRYINKITVPTRSNRWDAIAEYLNVRPHGPQELFGELNPEYVLQMRMIEPNRGAVVGLATTEPVTADALSIVLDVDVFDLEPARCESAESARQLFERFDRLRERKNHIFECCITEKAREAFR